MTHGLITRVVESYSLLFKAVVLFTTQWSGYDKVLDKVSPSLKKLLPMIRSIDYNLPPSSKPCRCSATSTGLIPHDEHGER